MGNGWVQVGHVGAGLVQVAVLVLGVAGRVLGKAVEDIAISVLPREAEDERAGRRRRDVLGLVQVEWPVIDRVIQTHRRDARGRRTPGTGRVGVGDRNGKRVAGLGRAQRVDDVARGGRRVHQPGG